MSRVSRIAPRRRGVCRAARPGLLSVLTAAVLVGSASGTSAGLVQPTVDHTAVMTPSHGLTAAGLGSPSGLPRLLPADPTPGPGGGGSGGAPGPKPGGHHDDSSSSGGGAKTPEPAHHDAPAASDGGKAPVPVHHDAAPGSPADAGAGAAPPAKHVPAPSGPVGQPNPGGQLKPEAHPAPGAPAPVPPAPPAAGAPRPDPAAPGAAGAPPAVPPTPGPNPSPAHPAAANGAPAASACGPAGPACTPATQPAPGGPVDAATATPAQQPCPGPAGTCPQPKPAAAGGAGASERQMSTSEAWGAMGMGAFKAFDGGLGVAEGEAATVGSDGALGIPALGWNALYGGIALEGAHEFGQGYNKVFGSDDSASSPPASITANSDRRSGLTGEGSGSATANPDDPEASLDPTRRDALNQAKRDVGVPRTQHPDSVTKEDLIDSATKKKVIGPDGQPVKSRVYKYTTPSGENIYIQEHSEGHQFGQGGVGDQGPHFNVRPEDNLKTGNVDGTQEHYPFRK